MTLISQRSLEVLRCPDCGSTLHIGAGRHPSLLCDGCGATYPVVDGIPDLTSKTRTPVPGQYRTETLSNVIAGVYDVAAPMMSATIWKCSPLRYIDAQHVALGRANPGVHIEAPIGTGLVFDRVLAPYHDVHVIGIDPSWKMLKRARRRLAHHGDRIQLVRADLDRLPLADNSAAALQSLNGLHALIDRAAALSEFARVTKKAGYIGGTALIRGQELAADAVLDRYERWGVFPMLRTAEFLVDEMNRAPLEDVQFTTHGAVLFWQSESATDDP
jgi:ubiquinone/menaquinone biosynthesis C-methylase UbiE/uncharacterized protein YbaR (Trm112 family)